MMTKQSLLLVTTSLVASFAIACTVHARPDHQTAPAGVNQAGPTAEPMPDQPMATEGGIVCNGAEDMEIRDRHIATDGDAIVINGACTITIVNSKIEAAGWAIVVNGSGDVVVIDSVVSGAGGSVALNGASDLRARGSQFFGRVARNGVADITDDGGNTWE